MDGLTLLIWIYIASVLVVRIKFVAALRDWLLGKRKEKPLKKRLFLLFK
jgi:hypothetical protein